MPVLDNDHGEIKIQSVANPDASPRIFLSFDDRCNCEERIAEEDMCVHEILAKNGYHQCFYNEMHFWRDFVSGSVHGWVPPMDTLMNDLIGYTPETIDDSDDDISLLVQDDKRVSDSDGDVGR